MRFLVDECTGPAVAAWLSDHSHEVFSVFEEARGMDDDESEAIHFVPEVAHVYISCTKCDSPDFQVLEGRGVILESIKGMKSDE